MYIYQDVHIVRLIKPEQDRSKMTLLNYWMSMKRYPKPNEVVGGKIPIVKSCLYLMEKFNQVAMRLFYSKNNNNNKLSFSKINLAL